jgi:hypothetical protein
MQQANRRSLDHYCVQLSTATPYATVIDKTAVSKITDLPESQNPKNNKRPLCCWINALPATQARTAPQKANDGANSPASLYRY